MDCEIHCNSPLDREVLKDQTWPQIPFYGLRDHYSLQTALEVKSDLRLETSALDYP